MVRREMKFSDPKKTIFAWVIFNKTAEKEKKLLDFNLSIFHCGLNSYLKTNEIINKGVDRKFGKDTVIKYNSWRVTLFLSITDRINY